VRKALIPGGYGENTGQISSGRRARSTRTNLSAFHRSESVATEGGCRYDR
jgi:hypothetical protein